MHGNESHYRNKVTSSKSLEYSPKLVLTDKAVVKDLAELPEDIRDRFLMNLEMARQGLTPVLRQEKLKAAGDGVIELKINGRPAYRCMYVRMKNGDVVVLHAKSKTAQGQDKQLVETTAHRLKRLAPNR
ncbi:type II toxin-antitoxin system RelE/ParE family toxin [Xanthomonas translucens]|uniref:type II toxin-antitoxin system RelE/ParE family toxin n=1 Tax=Xanthomonas campestris pv. translucens TaxID=343 RepID=UPI0019D6A569|nr:type II toxin-antitoxin system RelE/ParE family toxin [Xanthomonas translucens]MCT8273338.1 type II toxin-antitoxin system RelE/ParE family toxin [Xanthomonas translucens pv. translucens]MCT8277518.1 type II toxin-antitoxin system RelE/ParE family toxin [Xanthomonas translucens pv. translucens]MCT8306289.1 type II toxin-antitoxin system RelE/ParE family toxin [Xanthomonas translucens pv. translucens]QSQ38946.1 type II toxin-antitoxin system RelE/ParE family toxin [Xanthomonas translucens pv.